MMSSRTTATISLVNVPLFQGLSPEILARLQATCRRLSLERGDFLIKQGQKGKELYIIESGTVRVWQGGDNPQDLAILGPDEVVGELEIIDGRPSSANVQALEPVQSIVLSRDDFFYHLGQFPGMAIYMLTLLSDRLRKNNDMRSLYGSDAAIHARVAELVLLLSEYTTEPLDSERTLPRMARILGLSRETLEKILHAWQASGWIDMGLDSGQISISDQQELSQLAKS